MPTAIRPIRLALPYKLGSVNWYLITTGAGYLLIDTGSSNQRARLEQALKSAGCSPGDLKLIVLTHGDFDHTGNAVYLRQKFGAKIAMHTADAGMLERGDMFWNRKKGSALLRRMAPVLFGFGKSQRGSPDVIVAEGSDANQHRKVARAYNQNRLSRTRPALPMGTVHQTSNWTFANY